MTARRWGWATRASSVPMGRMSALQRDVVLMSGIVLG
jgi:hypothetical protein